MSRVQDKAAPLFLELTFENCYDEVDKLEGAAVSETSGVKVVTGDHPQFGKIHIIIPPMGNGMMMLDQTPVMIRVFHEDENQPASVPASSNV